MATKTLYLNSAGVSCATSGNLTISGNTFVTNTLSSGGYASFYPRLYLDTIFGTENVNISNVVVHCRAYGERTSIFYAKGSMLIGYIAGSLSWSNNTQDVGRGSSNATSYSVSVTTSVSAANCENDNGRLRFVPVIRVVNNSVATETFHVYDISIVVTYTIPTYTLTVNAGTGGTVSGGGTYNVDSTQTITATPNAGYRFVSWNDGNTSASRTVTVTGNVTYTATFAPITYVISTAASPAGAGTVNGAGTYNSGDSATLTATAAVGYVFYQWSDGNTSSTRIVTVTGNATYTAQFVSAMPEITAVEIAPNPANVSQGLVIKITAV